MVELEAVEQHLLVLRRTGIARVSEGALQAVAGLEDGWQHVGEAHHSVKK